MLLLIRCGFTVLERKKKLCDAGNVTGKYDIVVFILVFRLQVWIVEIGL